MMDLKALNAFHGCQAWEDPAILSLGRETPHTRWNERDGYTASLDGEWYVHVADCPQEAPENFWLPEYDASGWQRATVPGCLEAQGLAQPVYTNVLYPFDEADPDTHLEPHAEHSSWVYDRYAPPRVPRQNRTACYVRDFDLPETWKDLQVFLEVGAAESAFYLWINGQPAGYGQDSKTAAVFALTGLLQPGRNRIAIMVLRFSAATYLEDQDYFYLTGLTRSLRLMAKAEQHICDYFLTAQPAPGGGLVTGYCQVNLVPGYADQRVRLTLLDGPDQTLACQEVQIATRAEIYSLFVPNPEVMPVPGRAAFHLPVVGIELWDPDHPRLYHCRLELVSPQGEILDWETCRVGFRRIEIVDDEIRLNGRRVIFRGVNRHEHSYPAGRTVSRQQMWMEAKRMKQLNFNAVRTCHYPDDPAWYDICDEVGLMVVCEANVETHAMAGAISQDPRWAAAMLDRAMSMALIHKNHPCIVSWSLGNESGIGPGHGAMAGWLRAFDPNRLVQYESCHPGPAISDIRCPMYATEDYILSLLAQAEDRRPIVLVEYNYQIANAGGGMERFRRLTRQYRRFQGGFVWDWQDKLMPYPDGQGRLRPGFGGDFGEDFVEWQNPPFMCCNGIVREDLTCKPAAWEVAQAQAPFFLQEDPDGRLYLVNDSHSLNASFIAARYSRFAGGKPVEEGALALPPVEPGQRAEVVLPDWAEQLPNSWATIVLYQQENTDYAPAGRAISHYQRMLKPPAPFVSKAAQGNVTVKDSDNQLILEAAGVCAQFDLRQGCLTGLWKDGKSYVTQGGLPLLGRGRTGLDCHPNWGFHEDWAPYGPGQAQAVCVESQAFSTGDGQQGIALTNLIGPKDAAVQCRTLYRMDGAGQLHVTTEFNVPQQVRHLPRLSTLWRLDPALTRLSWQGLGPGESYCDRALSALYGLWEAELDELEEPFLPVSHHGTRSSVCRLTLSGPGQKLDIQGEAFSFDIHRYSVEQLWEALHPWDLPQGGQPLLALDAAMAGIGGEFAWSTQLDNAHRVLPGRYERSFIFRL